MTDFTRPSARSGQAHHDRNRPASRRRLGYSGPKTFQLELKTRVDAFFLESSSSRRDVAAWYFKATTIILTFAASYTLLVGFASTWWQAVPLTVVLALSVVGIGFNIMHDGGHAAVSRRIPSMSSVGARIYGTGSTVCSTTTTRTSRATTWMSRSECSHALRRINPNMHINGGSTGMSGRYMDC